MWGTCVKDWLSAWASLAIYRLLVYFAPIICQATVIFNYEGLNIITWRLIYANYMNCWIVVFASQNRFFFFFLSLMVVVTLCTRGSGLCIVFCSFVYTPKYKNVRLCDKVFMCKCFSLTLVIMIYFDWCMSTALTWPLVWKQWSCASGDFWLCLVSNC